MRVTVSINLNIHGKALPTLKSFPLKSNVLNAPTRGNASNARTLSKSAALGPSLSRSLSFSLASLSFSLSRASRSRSRASRSAAPPSPSSTPAFVGDSRCIEFAGDGTCRAVTPPRTLLATTGRPGGAAVAAAADCCRLRGTYGVYVVCAAVSVVAGWRGGGGSFPPDNEGGSIGELLPLLLVWLA